MKIANPYLIMLALSCYVLACSPRSLSGQKAPFPAGDYQYTSYDKQGNKVVEGRISITSVEPRRIGSEEQIQLKGNWELRKAGNQEKIGPQVGSGDLIGGIIKCELYIDLTPNISDANGNLRGKVEGKRCHGTWAFNG